MPRQVTVIPQTRSLHTGFSLANPRKRRTAAYARVSTDSEEQLTSYEAQVDYYTKLIKSKPDWEFVDVYTDEGHTGVMKKNRDGFNRMIQDALDGKIDLIVTKSVSRFARNTVDCLTTIRELKDHGIEVYFEKENIYTLDSKGELFITIMGSLAQEESRSISENVAWGHHKRFADGKLIMPYSGFLGYEKGEDGNPQIVESEAKIVRRIYSMFMDGMTPGAIAKQLTKEGVPTPRNKTEWRQTTIHSILTNEKYKGAALLQKKFTLNFLTKKQKVNEGELPQYYVAESHPAIIEPAEFDLVQKEMERRKRIGANYSGSNVFACRLICEDCGGYFGSKVWQSNTKYRKTIWQCNNKFKGEHKCETPHFTENEIKERFLTAFMQIAAKREELIEDCRLIQNALTDTTSIQKKLDTLYAEVDILNGLIRQGITQNAMNALDQDEYNRRYGEYAARYDRLKAKIEKLERKKEHRQSQFRAIEAFTQELEKHHDLPLTFDHKLWVASIDYATIRKDGKISFRFVNGTTIDA